MRKLWFVFSLLLCSAIVARGQAVVSRQVLAGSGTTRAISIWLARPKLARRRALPRPCLAAPVTKPEPASCSRVTVPS